MKLQKAVATPAGAETLYSNLTEADIEVNDVTQMEAVTNEANRKPYETLVYLESLLSIRRYRERDENIEQYVDPDTGETLPEVDGGMPFIKWVYSKIHEQQEIIRSYKE